MFEIIRCLMRVRKEILASAKKKAPKKKTEDHSNPENPYWAIYTISLEVGDIYVQTFETEQEARKYANRMHKGNTQASFLTCQVHLCRKEDSDAVLGAIDSYDGQRYFIDHLSKG